MTEKNDPTTDLPHVQGKIDDAKKWVQLKGTDYGVAGGDAKDKGYLYGNKPKAGSKWNFTLNGGGMKVAPDKMLPSGFLSLGCHNPLLRRVGMIRSQMIHFGTIVKEGVKPETMEPRSAGEETILLGLSDAPGAVARHDVLRMLRQAMLWMPIAYRGEISGRPSSGPGQGGSRVAGTTVGEVNRCVDAMPFATPVNCRKSSR